MERACDVCGKAYEALRASSRVCSTTCRVRKTRARQAGLVVPVVPIAPVAVTPAPSEAEGSLYAATLAELVAAGREGSALGRSALLLARRLDGAVREPGMGMAALAKQHEQTLAGAVRGAARAADPVDELRAARDRKRNSA